MDIKVSQKAPVPQLVILICLGLHTISLPGWGGVLRQSDATLIYREVVCIGAPNINNLSVQFAKGSARYNSEAGSFDISRQTRLESGDTIATGDDGFVSILFSKSYYQNVHPNTLVVLSDVGCEHNAAQTGSDVLHKAAHLNAAIRG